ncbi:uncharacterized protein LOC131292916 [Anopheles ziemanni]|uniref:uncharacterized protein LOC131271267 n=1 Tax=Anopheles coustani TaxID=139045 RepID=UPI00265AAEAD|nr:uncharacterized protein LOC131271267 [Anopheles coustani]XP_058176998.1 uncharacterized protein LOC131292916 [Anopheles ziemanni]
MASRSSKYRKALQYIAELEQEVEPEMEIISPTTGSLEEDVGVINTSDSVGESSGSGNVATNNNIENVDSEVVEELPDIPTTSSTSEEFWDEGYRFVDEFETLMEALRYIAIVGQLSRNFLNLLLAILRKFGHPDLPKDARTLVRTPKVAHEIQKVTGGKFWYQGIEVALKNYFNGGIPEATNFKLQICIDGLPLFKSSSTQFWPILVKVEELKDCPIFVAGIFSGQKKPDNLESFLRPLVCELNELQLTGLNFFGKIVSVCVSAFIADSPARSFIKSVMSFSAKHGCTKCSTLGIHVQPENKVIFEGVGAAPRTDVGFRAREDRAHHKVIRTPLEDVANLDMIKNFLVADRLHLIDLGVSRKLLQGFLTHKMTSFNRWSSDQKVHISKFLNQSKLPCEINRPFRALDSLHFWKGTEFRSFLHYISPVIYIDFMHNEGYNHYLHYFCGVTIFSSSAYKHLWPVAGRLIAKFVKDFPTYYGRTHMTSNVHNLLHMYEDVQVHGQLENFSAYDFENHLQFLKRCVRKGSKCLEQVADRSKEFASINVAPKQGQKNYPRLTVHGVKVTSCFDLAPNFKDQWFLTTSNCIVKFLRGEMSSTNSLTLIGILYESKETFFNCRLEDEVSELNICSSEINIYTLTSLSPWRRVRLTTGSIKCKLVPINLPPRPLVYFEANEFSDSSLAPILFIPLLHTFINN